MDTIAPATVRPLRFAYPIAFLQLVDAYTTHELLKVGGEEANPIGQMIIDTGHLWSAKIFAATVVLILAWEVRRRDAVTPLLQGVTTVVFVVYAVAMMTNSAQLLAYWSG